MRQPITYKGYEVNQSILDRTWYADPINSLTSEHRLTAAHPAALRALIDDATTASLNPWELPMRGAVPVAA